jgi:enterochelin esterase-like enzyme
MSTRPALLLLAVPVFALLFARPLTAQAPPPAGRGAQPGGGQRAPVVVSPEVLPDRRVIVRLYAPQAQDVRVSLDGGVKLAKGGNGVWEATVGPLDPGGYRYSFTVDGATVTDPSNSEMERMQVVTRSILYVPGAAFMDTKTVPHGAVSVVTYYSNVLKKFRRFHVYTPPGYEANQQKYPVLYLLHGANESDDSWSTVGRGNFILDNLIADGKAVPMIVVMPNGHIDQTPPNSGAPASQRVEFATFPNEFVSDIMPYVESQYRTIPDRPHRAIAGLSMGGAQTLNIAFGNLDWFSAIGVFSSGILGGNVADWEKSHLAALDDQKLKEGLKMIWFSTGREDTLITVSKASVEMLNRHGFAATFQESTGAHTWLNWRNYLNEIAPRLFR